MSAFLPYQAAFYADPAKLRVIEKSRRVGITWSEAARQVMLASRRREEGGTDCSYLSTSHRLARKYISTCAMWARELGCAATALGSRIIEDAGRDVLKHEIHFASGHVVQALTSNPEAMRGEGGDVIIDEAAHHQDLLELLKAARAMGDWGGGRLTLISTHNGVDNPFNGICEELRSKARRGALHRVTIHDALAQGLFRRRCEVERVPFTQEAEDDWLAEALASWGSDEEYLVIPSASGGVYIRRDLIEACMELEPVPSAKLDLPPDHHLRLSEAERESYIRNWIDSELRPLLRLLAGDQLTTLGVDFARSARGDLSVMAPLSERPDLKKRCPWWVELRGVPYEEQWQILKAIVDAIPRFGGGVIDGAGNGGWLGEKAVTHYSEQVFSTLQLSESWYAEFLPRFRRAFEEHQILVPRDANVRDDLLLFRMNRNGVPHLPHMHTRDAQTRKPRHGDAAIALLLAHSRHHDAPPELLDFHRTGRARAAGRRSYLP